jgi:hypothetical protein
MTITAERPTSTMEPVRLSDALERVALDLLYDLMYDHLDPQVLTELAYLKAHSAPRMVARNKLTAEGIEKLTDILVNRRSIPTRGFWTRYAS